MCQIIYKPENKKFDFEKMDRAQKFNKDGYGLMCWDGTSVQTWKTMSYKDFKEMLEVLEDFTVVVHLRNTTVGDTNVKMCHPFSVPSGHMMHNGTMFFLKRQASKGLSDTHVLAKMLRDCEFTYAEDIRPLLSQLLDDKINRLVFMDNIDGEVTFVNEDLGMWEEGVWFSNDYHKREEIKTLQWGQKADGTYGYLSDDDIQDLLDNIKEEAKKEIPKKRYSRVFVYGTLKKGLHNHYYFLKEAKFLGKATAVEEWTMVGENMSFPYVLGKSKLNDWIGHKIQGEVYLVDEETKKNIDRLEGVPTHYKEGEIEVEYESGVKIKCNIYIKTNVSKDDIRKKAIANWDRVTQTV